MDSDDYNVFSSALPEDLAHIPLATYKRYSEEEMLQRSSDFYVEMNNRRTLRYYSPEPVPEDVIKNIVRTAGTHTPILSTTIFIYLHQTQNKVKLNSILYSYWTKRSSY